MSIYERVYELDVLAPPRSGTAAIDGPMFVPLPDDTNLFL